MTFSEQARSFEKVSAEERKYIRHDLTDQFCRGRGIYNPGQNKLGHWQISMFSSCFLKYRGENIRLEPSHPPSPLIQCWDGRMAFDSTNIETGGAGGTESKTEVVQFCDLSQEF